jgi:hypothetical protein
MAITDPAESGEHAPKWTKLGVEMVQLWFCQMVTEGEIEIGERPIDQILEDYKAFLSTSYESIAENRLNVSLVVDYTEELWDCAEREAIRGFPQLAATFYALWIEHMVNGNLITGLQRKGYGAERISRLIRNSPLNAKITTHWKMAGFRQLPDEDVRLIKQVFEARNSFVHYKWPTADSSLEESLRQTIERARSIKGIFGAAIDDLYWNSRKTEVLAALFGNTVTP